MAIITRPKTDSSHWYTLEGKPMHTVPTADGKDTRPTNVRDARKLHLAPSVTNVLGVLAKEQLATWKVNQAILCSLVNPKGQQEPEDSYCKRISSMSMEQVYEAASLGSSIHAGIEMFLKDGSEPEDQIAPYVKPVTDWILSKSLKVHACEKILVDAKYGYAGTADLLFKFGSSGQGYGVIDFKTRKSEPKKKMSSWDTEPLQLAAYAHTAWGEEALPDCLIANILISTTEPGRFEVVKHADPHKHFDAFIATLKVWRYMKKYEWEPVHGQD